MKPIFIGGCSRSGTTLLGSMLGAHSQMITTPESHFKTEVYLSLENPDKEIETALDRIVRHRRFRHWCLPPLNRHELVDRAQSSYSRLILCLVGLYGQTHSKHPDGSLWVDHTPSNINYTHLLRNLFPDFKMIHIVRDGRAVAASIMNLDWGPNTAIGAARFWLENLSFGLAVEHFFGPKRILRISFEALVTNPFETMQTICKFIDQPFEDGMIQGDGFSPPKYTIGQHQLVGKPPNAMVAEKWKQQLTPSQIRDFEGIAADMLLYLGYTRYCKGKPVFPSVSARLKSDLSEIIRTYFINMPKHQYRRSR